ncbi:MAG TPA: aldehyde dehydrogenase [Bacteroidetes bacterium]|nr:aldehyde dehydrogenase [Bacteroidota bacterium]
MQNRLQVLKTYKIYIGGKYERSESGRYYPLTDKSGKQIANVCLSSKKDFRNAVVTARGAQLGWANRSAYNRSQILYRMAEMMEGRSAQFIEEMSLEGISNKQAQLQVEQAVDRLVYYAGWCDKITQVFGTINPVASSHFNFSVPEPTGVVSIIAPESNALVGLINAIAPVIAAGNTCIVLLSEKNPLSGLTFAEVLGTSDLPGGVVNLLTGTESELLDPFSNHMDVNAMAYHRNNAESKKTIQLNAALNVRRVHFYNTADKKNVEVGSPYKMLDFMEIKTTWHPIGV